MAARWIAVGRSQGEGRAGDHFGYADACRYSFTVANVPAGETTYRVTLGSNISNSVGFTEDQLTTGGANITMGH